MGELPSNSTFRQDLIELINRHSIDAYCNIPDYLLAEFVMYQISIIKKTTDAAWLMYRRQRPTERDGTPDPWVWTTLGGI